jgi:hypothetical protein
VAVIDVPDNVNELVEVIVAALLNLIICDDPEKFNPFGPVILREMPDVLGVVNRIAPTDEDKEPVNVNAPPLLFIVFVCKELMVPLVIVPLVITAVPIVAVPVVVNVGNVPVVALIEVKPDGVNVDVITPDVDNNNPDVRPLIVKVDGIINAIGDKVNVLDDTIVAAPLNVIFCEPVLLKFNPFDPECISKVMPPFEFGVDKVSAPGLLFINPVIVNGNMPLVLFIVSVTTEFNVETPLIDSALPTTLLLLIYRDPIDPEDGLDPINCVYPLPETHDDIKYSSGDI